MRVEVLICTFRRPQVARTLRSVAAQDLPRDVALSVIVVDNDATPSARAHVDAAAAATGLAVRYLHHPGGDVALARNAALEAASAPWIAFLDDDEEADPGWLRALIARQRATGADGVFGPSRAVYGPEAPRWIVAGDFHSQRTQPRGGVVETGHTCNALLRWGEAPWRDQRFDPARGRSGGEDTEFFFRLRRLGARYAVAETALVWEAVPPERLSLRWLLRRRFRIGQSYAARATAAPQRAALMATAAAKSGYSFLRALPAWPRPTARAFWLMRGTMHLGVCAGCLRLPQPRLYGEAAR